MEWNKLYPVTQNRNVCCTLMWCGKREESEKSLHNVAYEMENGWIVIFAIVCHYMYAKAQQLNIL